MKYIPAAAEKKTDTSYVFVRVEGIVKIVFGLQLWQPSQSSPAIRTQGWFGFGYTPDQLLTLSRRIQKICNKRDFLNMSQSSATNSEDGSKRANNESVAVDSVIDFKGKHFGLESTSEDSDDYLVSGSEGTMIDVERFCHADYRIEQYAHSVLDFSSQYGIDLSISYTAPNITGRPSKYPEYGDFPQTFAMRTYGAWWDRAPSRLKEIQPQNVSEIPAEDFIDKEFYTKPLYSPSRARRFTPPLKRIQLPTKTIRLEFNHQRLHYYTEIDAVLLSGKKFNTRNMQHLLDYYERQRKGSILCKLQNMKFRPICRDNYQNRLQHFLMHDLDKFISVLSDVQIQSIQHQQQQQLQSPSTDEIKISKIGLKNMPFEIMLKIFSYLDLKSLFRVGAVSRFLYDVSTHPLLYSELNLKPYWHLASTELLSTLAKRATILKKLDMSWCGCTVQTISPTEFKKFIQQRGDSLTHLRLNSTKFLNASCIDTLGIVCDNLKELSLRNCSPSPPLLNFSCLANLKNLERLDLFQTVIESDLLLTMLENNPKLKHLNLAFCSVAVNMDDVAQHIAKYNKQLISLDMWKAHFLSAQGLREASLGDSLREFLTQCTKLRKLFLAAVRGLTDRDLEYIANLCPNLEQLDLMGVLGISKERYIDILQKCAKLQLLDLCFCDNIMDYDVALWSRTFKVDIKSCQILLFISFRSAVSSIKTRYSSCKAHILFSITALPGQCKYEASYKLQFQTPMPVYSSLLTLCQR
uniref:F-box domain-containing protein n=1 Tax=Glossina austeni TaxID=7395 RepID=A0A1A9UZP8_GLOAU